MCLLHNVDFFASDKLAGVDKLSHADPSASGDVVDLCRAAEVLHARYVSTD